MSKLLGTAQRIYKPALVIVVLLVGLSVVAGVQADRRPETIDLYWTSVTLEESQPTVIDEAITYNFGSHSRHGIFRDVPELDTGAGIVVESPTAPDQFTISAPRIVELDGTEYTVSGAGGGLDTRIQIGDPNVEIGGQHVYNIQYPLDVTDGNQIRWHAVGAEWPTGITEVEIHVVSDREILDPKCESFIDQTCSFERPEPGHLVINAQNLEPQQGVLLVADLGDSLDSVPKLPEPSDAGSPMNITSPVLVALTIAVAAVAGAAAGIILIYRLGREQVSAGDSGEMSLSGRGSVHSLDKAQLIDLSGPQDRLDASSILAPQEIPAWQGGILLFERVEERHKVAWMLEQELNGRLHIDDRSRKIERVEPPRVRDQDPVFEVDQLLSGRRKVDLRKFDKRFAKAWQSLGESLEDWRLTSTMWDTSTAKRSKATKYGSYGIGAVAVAGLLWFSTFVRSSDEVVLSVAGVLSIIVGLSLAGMFFHTELHVMTPEGSRNWIQIQKFRQALEEKNEAVVERAVIQDTVMDHTVWAVALGLSDQWQSLVRSQKGSTEFDPLVYGFAMNSDSLTRLTRSASTEPSSNSGGSVKTFSSGGGGGGAGGGGGGSW